MNMKRAFRCEEKPKEPIDDCILESMASMLGCYPDIRETLPNSTLAVCNQTQFQAFLDLTLRLRFMDEEGITQLTGCLPPCTTTNYNIKCEARKAPKKHRF